MARQTLEQKLAAAELARNRLRHALSERRRAEETRRKIVVGGTILAAMQDDPALHDRVVALLRRMVTRDIDRVTVSDLLADATEAAAPPVPIPDSGEARQAAA